MWSSCVSCLPSEKYSSSLSAWNLGLRFGQLPGSMRHSNHLHLPRSDPAPSLATKSSTFSWTYPQSSFSAHSLALALVHLLQWAYWEPSKASLFFSSQSWHHLLPSVSSRWSFAASIWAIVDLSSLYSWHALWTWRRPLKTEVDRFNYLNMNHFGASHCWRLLRHSRESFGIGQCIRSDCAFLCLELGRYAGEIGRPCGCWCQVSFWSQIMKILEVICSSFGGHALVRYSLCLNLVADQGLLCDVWMALFLPDLQSIAFCWNQAAIASMLLILALTQQAYSTQSSPQKTSRDWSILSWSQHSSAATSPRQYQQGLLHIPMAFCFSHIGLISNTTSSDCYG